MPSRLLVVALFLSFLASVSAAIPEFESWPEGKSPAEIGARIARRFVPAPHFEAWDRPKLPPMIYYWEVCTWYGALKFAKVVARPDLSLELVKRFEPLLGDQACLIPETRGADLTRFGAVDFAVFGALPIELGMQTGERRYLDLGLEMARRQWAAPSDQELASLSPEARQVAGEAYYRDGLTWQTRYWIDDLYMIPLLQTQAYRATGAHEYLDRTARLVVAYLDKLNSTNGLFHHAPGVPFYWGRGNGWVAAGLTELLSELPETHPLRPRILDAYKAMMAALLTHQAEDGMWRQLIDRPESWPETSCTAMFTFAFVEGVKNGWLDAATYAPSARRAWLRLTDYLDADAGLREVCIGTNKRNDYQYYIDRPRATGNLHGQAPMLWTATSLLR